MSTIGQISLRKRSMSTKGFNRSFGVTKKKAMRTMVAVFGTTKDFTIDLGIKLN
jgi:hypothetical protein